MQTDSSAYSNSKIGYIRGIDGLRAFAVVAVMIYHLNPSFLKGGFTGVDLFFVISGYVVSGSLYRGHEKSFLRYILSFYARRVLRIIPALVVFLLFFGLITTLFIPHSWLSGTTPKTALSALFGYSNLVLVWYNDGYFSPRVEFNPFAHTWSLGVEEQFYLVFPLLFFLWYRLESYLFKVLIFVLFISSSLFSVYMTYKIPTHAFYFLPSRFWELLSGAILFGYHKNLKDTTKRNRVYLYAGVLILFLGFISSNSDQFPFPWVLLPVSGTLFVIDYLVVKPQTDIGFVEKMLQNSAVVYIGKISYSLYLWHWGIYVFFRWTIGMNRLYEMITATLLTFFLSILSYHFVEQPIRKNTHILAMQNFKIVALGLFTLFVSHAILSTVFKAQPRISLSVTKNRNIWYPNAYHSKTRYKTAHILKGHKLFVFGDSHAMAYSTMLQKLSDRYGIKVYKFSSGNCPVADLLTPGISKNIQCKKYIQKIISRIEKLASPDDTLFLASLRMNRLADQWTVFSQSRIYEAAKSKKAVQNRNLALNETEKLIQKFERLKLNIVIDAPKPVFRSPPFRCSDWFNKKNPICMYGFAIKRDFLLTYRMPVMNSLATLKKKFSKLIVWDPFPILCPSEICYSFKGKKPLFFDADHLSAYGNKILYPSFLQVIKKIYKTDFKDKI